MGLEFDVESPEVVLKNVLNDVEVLYVLLLLI